MTPGPRPDRAHGHPRLARAPPERGFALMEWMNLPLVQGGVWTLLGGVLVAIFTGRLLPRWYVTQLRDSDQNTIERQRDEIKEWRDAAHASELANRELMEQVQELMETGRLANQLFRSAVKEGGGVD